jgi:hypothetical protein
LKRDTIYDIIQLQGKPDTILNHIFKEDIIMSETLNRVAAFGGENGACGTSDPAPSACGAADPKPSSCGSACGAADPDKK